MYVIEDEHHAEPVGEFPTFEQALVELRRLASLPWDQPPNQAPCTSWATCGRAYEVIEYDITREPWAVISRIPALDVSARGIVWALGLKHEPLPVPDA